MAKVVRFALRGAPATRRPDPVLLVHDALAVPLGAFTAAAVPNGRLTSDAVPGPGAVWEEVEEFALSYDGYGYWSDVAELARRTLQRWTRDHGLPHNLDELRGCLFYEERRWHHFGREPLGPSRQYFDALLAAIGQLAGRADSSGVETSAAADIG
ncbi:MAG TPA: hypothetical protein VK386_06130 [Acidimicrobiales bacterium]|nr:hypothetical protein [Acidimicrobiales bacterium]